MTRTDTNSHPPIAPPPRGDTSPNRSIASSARRAPVVHADGLAALSEAVVSGRSLQEVTRAAARALDASLLVADDAGAPIAVAAPSPADERALLGTSPAAHAYELRREEGTVGRLLLRRPDPPPPSVVRLVRTLIAAEVQRHGANDRGARAEEGELARALLRGDPVAREREVRGGAVLIARAVGAKRMPAEWEARLLLIVRRAAMMAVHRPLATVLDPSTEPVAGETRIAVIVPSDDDASVPGAAERIARRLVDSEGGNRLALGYSRHTAGSPASQTAGPTASQTAGPTASQTAGPTDFHRAGQEAALAARLAGPGDVLAFADTGAYRLLLPFARAGSAELRAFYRDTIGPLVDHDAATGTELVATLETFLESDASPSRAARRLLTHRHTVRYRLGQIRELTGLDVSSTTGRERLGLGLKAMRVLAVWAPAGGYRLASNSA